MGKEVRSDVETLRAADADRQKVADQLKAALDEGRLSLHEYDDRVAPGVRVEDLQGAAASWSPTCRSPG